MTIQLMEEKNARTNSRHATVEAIVGLRQVRLVMPTSIQCLVKATCKIDCQGQRHSISCTKSIRVATKFSFLFVLGRALCESKSNLAPQSENSSHYFPRALALLRIRTSKGKHKTLSHTKFCQTLHTTHSHSTRKKKKKSIFQNFFNLKLGETFDIS